MTYKLCKRLLNLGGLNHHMLDVFFAAGRLSDQEYTELSALYNERESV